MAEVAAPPSLSLDPGELRGQAARKSLVEDACWAIDTIFSGREVPEFSPYVGLLVTHHFVRIAYEGAAAIRCENPHVGIPGLAARLKDSFAQLTERARHLTKMLDNNKKSYTDIISEFAAELGAHRNALTGKASGLARWLGIDLGLFFIDGFLVGASIPIAYRLGLDPARPTSLWGEDLAAVTEEWGGTPLPFSFRSCGSWCPVSG